MQTLSDSAEKFVSDYLNKIKNKEDLDNNSMMFMERMLRMYAFYDDIINEMINLTKGEVKLYNNSGKQNLSNDSEKEINQILDIMPHFNLNQGQRSRIERSLRVSFYHEELLDTQLYLTKYPTKITYQREKNNEEKT